MRKSDLEKLRTLRATPSMVKKMSEPGRMVVSSYYTHSKRTNKYRYGCAMRCQYLGGIIKVALFTPTDLNAGVRDPKYEIFINPEGEEWISRERTKNGWEWRTAMIHNLHDYWRIHYDYDHLSYMNPEGTKTIKRVLKVKDGGYRGIMTWQQRINEQRKDEKYKRETAAWDAAMAKVPKDFPEGFELFGLQKGIKEHYIFYDYDRKGQNKGYCTCCDKEVTGIEPKYNKEDNCPVCKTPIVYKSKAKLDHITVYGGQASLIQNYEDGLVIRYFRINASFYAKGHNDLSFYEIRRVVFSNGNMTTYVYEMYKQRCTRWITASWAHGGMASYPLYQKNVAAVFRRSKWPTAYMLMRRHNRNMDICSYLKTELYNPAIEMSVKAELYRLAKEILNIRYDRTLLNESQTELPKLLKIDSARLKRLKAMKGGVDALKWLQYEKEVNTQWPDEVIDFYGKQELEPDDFDFILDKMTPVKVMNYLIKQTEITGEKVRQLRITWRDYLNMAKRAKVDITKEQFYKPKNINKAHADMIALANKKDMEREAAKRLKEYPDINTVCKELTKYEWSDEEYAVVTPKSIMDIFLEGTILNHCIHRCDFYFDRINQREAYLVFLRRKCSIDTPWYTLEIEPNGTIRQKRTTGDNQNKDLDDAIPFLKKWQQEITKRLSEEDKELAKKSAEARKKNYTQLRKDKKLVWHGKLQGKLLADVLENDLMEVI